MKKIVCYNTRRAHPAMWSNMMSLVEGFRAIGIRAEVCDLDDPSSVQQTYDDLLSDHPSISYTVGFNDLGMKLKDGEETFYPYDVADVPHVSYMLDVPYSRYVSGFDLPCRNRIVTLLDRHLPDAMPVLFPDSTASTMFLPLGGTPALPDEAVFTSERSYDVVVSASLWGKPAYEDRTNLTQGLPEGTARFVDLLADRLEAEPVSVWDAFCAEADARGYDRAMRRSFAPCLWRLLRYIKRRRRIRAVSFLADLDLRVDVFGAGWETVPFAERLHLHGGMSYEEMLPVFGKAKVIYQDNAEFSNGAHDRVFTAMLSGAVVVSEYSTYLVDIFDEGRDIFLFDWKHGREQVADILPQILGDEAFRLSTALLAYRKAAKQHTWTARAGAIDEAVAVRFGIL